MPWFQDRLSALKTDVFRSVLNFNRDSFLIIIKPWNEYAQAKTAFIDATRLKAWYLMPTILEHKHAR